MLLIFQSSKQQGLYERYFGEKALVINKAYKRTLGEPTKLGNWDNVPYIAYPHDLYILQYPQEVLQLVASKAPKIAICFGPFWYKYRPQVPEICYNEDDGTYATARSDRYPHCYWDAFDALQSYKPDYILSPAKGMNFPQSILCVDPLLPTLYYE